VILAYIGGIYLVYDLGCYDACLRHIVETLAHLGYILDTWYMVDVHGMVHG
jgi:hypothetical protein